MRYRKNPMTVLPTQNTPPQKRFMKSIKQRTGYDSTACFKPLPGSSENYSNESAIPAFVWLKPARAGISAFLSNCIHAIPILAIQLLLSQNGVTYV